MRSSKVHSLQYEVRTFGVSGESRIVKTSLLSVLFTLALISAAARAGTVDTPILFVTQVPVPGDFTTITSTFGNHRGSLDSVHRGGDLYIRYPDGTLKNLTAAAGFGMSGAQGANSIAVREPSVHWNGTKAIFSMVIGSPLKQFEVKSFNWQLYEITGLGQADTPVITKVPNQPATYNNVSPTYGTDDRIIFTSDRPRGGEAHLYPQLDEYEEAPTVSGLWNMDPATGDLFLMSHNPSGNFTPTVDSFGRVIFTRWDHLQRDQQADGDAVGDNYGTFNYTDESASAATLFGVRTEVFPEPRVDVPGSNLERHTFNQFFPWQINEDGTEEETINHIGRHELHSYFNRSFNNDPNLVEHSSATPRTNPNSIQNFFQIKESAFQAGTYFGIDAPEFGTHAGGQIISINGAPQNPDQMIVTYVTHRDTASFTEEGTPPSVNHTGLYRTPLPLANGTLVAVHTAETRADKNEGTRANPTSRYAFRIKTLKSENGFMVADQLLTTGISKSVNWFDPDVLVSYSGELWELDPVEVRARTKPAKRTNNLEDLEAQIFAEEGVDLAVFKNYLREKNLAVVVSRNATTRDVNDLQQPFNLQVPNTTVKSIGKPGKVYDVSHLQFFQGDQIRGIGLQSAGGTPRQGRRVLPQVMHDPAVINPPLASSAPKGSVAIAADGSTAAFVPARRAMTWQLTDPAGAGVVRERYWLTFQPGEIRSCTSCHGLNTKDQVSRSTPQNKPEALRQLLQFFKTNPDNGGGNGGGGNGNGGLTDTDGDGFPDALEGALGTSPNDGASTPFGGAPAGTAQTLTLTKVGVKLDFAKAGKDTVGLKGTLPVPADFDANGKVVSVFVGGVAATFTLDAKGASPRSGNAFKLLLKKKKKVVTAQNATFSAAFGKGSYASMLADEKIDGSATAKGEARTVNVIVLFNQTLYQVTQNLTFTAMKGRTGSAKMAQ